MMKRKKKSAEVLKNKLRHETALTICPEEKLDLNISLSENYSRKMAYYDSVKSNIRAIQNQIDNLNKSYEEIPNDISHKKQKRMIKVLIIEKQDQLAKLKLKDQREAFMIKFSAVLAKKDSIIQQSKYQKKTQEKNSSRDYIIYSKNPIVKKRKRKNNAPPKNVVKLRTLESYLTKSDITDNEEKMLLVGLAENLTEDIVVQSNTDVCPTHPNVQLEYTENPPSLCCPICGVSLPSFDVYSTVVYDKNEKSTNNFSYHEETFWAQWMKRLSGKCKADISQEDLDAFYLALYNRKIFSVKNVTWNVIEDIAHNLAKTKNSKEFSRLYPLVYTITDMIRGKTLLELTKSDYDELRNIFKKILNDWNMFIQPHVHEWVDRQNFLSNPILFQLSFFVLGYPKEIIMMLRQMKGDDNMQIYQKICNLLCERNGWPKFIIQHYSNSGQNVHQELILPSYKDMIDDDW